MHASRSLASSARTGRVDLRPSLSPRITRWSTPVLCQAKVQSDVDATGRREAILGAAAALVAGVAQPQAARAEEPVPESEFIAVNITLSNTDNQFRITTSPSPLIMKLGQTYRIEIFNASKTLEHNLALFPEFLNQFTTDGFQIMGASPYGAPKMVTIPASSFGSIKEVILESGTRAYWTIKIKPAATTGDYPLRCNKHGMKTTVTIAS